MEWILLIRNAAIIGITIEKSNGRRKAVFRDVLEIVIVNAYILYKNRIEKPLTHKEFRLHIVKHLLSNWKMKKTMFQTKASQKMHYFDKIPNKKTTCLLSL